MDDRALRNLVFIVACSKPLDWTITTLSGGPIVLVGEEIHSIRYHVLAIGIRDSIAWRQSASSAIDEVHRQNGVAIAAHPTRSYSEYDAEAMRKLDAAEVVHPREMKRSPLNCASLTNTRM